MEEGGKLGPDDENPERQPKRPGRIGFEAEYAERLLAGVDYDTDNDSCQHQSDFRLTIFSHRNM